MHAQQNLKKKFAYLNRKKCSENKTLSEQIIKLPYHNYIDEFEAAFKQIKKSKLISSELKDYLDDKVKGKKLWAKCFMK